MPGPGQAEQPSAAPVPDIIDLDAPLAESAATIVEANQSDDQKVTAKQVGRHTLRGLSETNSMGFPASPLPFFPDQF